MAKTPTELQQAFIEAATACADAAKSAVKTAATTNDPNAGPLAAQAAQFAAAARDLSAALSILQTGGPADGPVKPPSTLYPTP